MQSTEDEKQMDVQVLQFDARVGMGTFLPWLKELGCQINCCRCDLEAPPTATVGPVLLLGGYMGVNDRDQLPYLQMAAAWIAREVRRGRPVLGICLGGQLLAHALGGTVRSQSHQERGIQNITVTAAGKTDPLFAGLPDPFKSFEWHNDSFDLPPAATHLAQTETCRGQAFRHANAWGLQFHPEVDEQIVAEWCERTGSGHDPLKQIVQHREIYHTHSRQLLANFIQASKSIPTER